MTDKPEPQSLRVLPDKVRYVEARMANFEDRLETLEHQRSSFVPSRSFLNLSGRQREIVYLLVLIVAMELVSWLMKRGLPSAV